MDDFKVIIWIIIGIVYLLTRRKKTAPPPTRDTRPAEDHEAEAVGPAPKTFEEQVREPARGPEPRRVQEVVDYDDDLKPEEQDLEDVTPSTHRSDEDIYKVYEEAKAKAFSRPSLEETLSLEDTIVRFKQFKGYEKEPRKKILHGYLTELRDPEGFKKAFILSEILRPRY
jgi:hypothetical protein